MTKDARRKWPKILRPLTEEEQAISDDFMKYWHTILPSYFTERFNQTYVVRYGPKQFSRTLEIGAGLGGHLPFEHLTEQQKKNYVALELREDMVAVLRDSFPDITALLGDCQEKLPYPDGYFDRILAIHVLEHLPNLPAAIREFYRLCDKQKGVLSIVIPCEGGLAYSLARKISAQRIFEKRYKQPYDWFIKREHINVPWEIFEELGKYFEITHRVFSPLRLPFVFCNLGVGLTLSPKKIDGDLC